MSLPTMQQMVSDKFGLRVPQDTLRMIIARATKRGYFRRNSGVIYKVQQTCEALDFKRTKDAVENTYSRVTTRLRQFANYLHGRSWSNIDAEKAILDFLVDNSLSLLFDLAEGRRRDSRSEGSRFLVATFVEHAQDIDVALLDDLELLARGNLIANAMYLPDSGGIKKQFRSTFVYFDTSFIAYAGGFAGPKRAATCLELLELLTQCGARLRCFKATRTELQGILDACGARLRRGQLRNGFMAQLSSILSETGKNASDLELMCARRDNSRLCVFKWSIHRPLMTSDIRSMRRPLKIIWSSA